MALSFLRRGRTPEPEPVPVSVEAPPSRPVLATFDGLTDDYRLIGSIALEGRLSDAVNRREPFAISDAFRAPTDGSAPFVADPSYTIVDPYGFAIIFAGSDSLPDYSREENEARKVRKQFYNVMLDVAPFRVSGTIWLYPGTTAEELVGGRIKELFLPVTNAEIWLGELRLDSRGANSVLVNRFELRGVQDTED